MSAHESTEEIPAGVEFLQEALIELRGFALRYSDSHEKLAQVDDLIRRALAQLSIFAALLTFLHQGNAEGVDHTLGFLRRGMSADELRARLEKAGEKSESPPGNGQPEGPSSLDELPPAEGLFTTPPRQPSLRAGRGALPLHGAVEDVLNLRVGEPLGERVEATAKVGSDDLHARRGGGEQARGKLLFDGVEFLGVQGKAPEERGGTAGVAVADTAATEDGWSRRPDLNRRPADYEPRPESASPRGEQLIGNQQFFEFKRPELEQARNHALTRCSWCGCSESNACVVDEDGAGAELRGCQWSLVEPSICDACIVPNWRVRGPVNDPQTITRSFNDRGAQQVIR